MLEGQIIITGGGGFIARAIYRRALAEHWPAEFVALGREDGKLRDVQERFPNVVDVRRVNVADAYLVEETFGAIKPAGVIHAAAAKYVDVSELNAWDTYETNVRGSVNVALAAAKHARWLVGISTDKACQPVNTYGATKFLMERLYQEAASWPDLRVTVCRYGNVIGSTGSALPRMRAQARKGDPITVTSPDMTRFWMTSDEAVDCILHAITEAPNGSVTVPTDVRASDLMTAVHGAVGDLRLVTMGERPGEKSHETLITANECRDAPGRAHRYVYILPPAERTPGRGLALTSDAPWAGRWTAGEISHELDKVEDFER